MDVPVDDDGVGWSLVSVSATFLFAAPTAHNLVSQQNPLHFRIFVLTFVNDRLKITQKHIFVNFYDLNANLILSRFNGFSLVLKMPQ